ncbi:MAG: GIY-YIG nuclease family protein [Patescibacteria group bacterium]
MYTVYVLKSTKDNKLYIGCSKDVLKRLLEHNSGKNKSTRYRRPFNLVFKEDYEIKSDAFKREWYFKHTAEGNILMRKLSSATNLPR